MRSNLRYVWSFTLLVAFLAGMFLAVPAQGFELPSNIPQLERERTTDSDKFTFAILGDRTGGSPDEWPVFDRAIEEINLLRPDFVIMVGDLIEGYTDSIEESEAQWEEFFEHASKLEVPFLMLPGNHDIYSRASYNWWKENLGDTYYSFVYKNCLFIILNNEEHHGLDDRTDPFGPAQVDWAVAEIAKHPDARHTFVLLHNPVWNRARPDSQDPLPSWLRIEQALAGRPHSFFAGHQHRLSFEERNDARYIVVAATKGAVIRRPNPNPQSGAFPHFVLTTVEGDDVIHAMIEPGGIWPEDIAPLELRRALASIIRLETDMPEGLGTAQGRAGFTSILQNTMPEPITVTASFPELEATGWRRGDDNPLTLTLQPGEGETMNWTLLAPESVFPLPRVDFVVQQDGNIIARAGQSLQLHPHSALRYPAEWMVVGPYKGEPMQSAMPPNPRESMAWIFERQGPEDGYQDGKVFEANGQPLEWRRQEATNENGPGFVNVGSTFEIPYDEYAYATAAVYSPEAKRVYARFRVDDYGIIYLNGEMLETELMRTRRIPAWIAFDLEQGWNTIVVKNAAITGGWTFWLGFGDPDGTLRFAPYPPEN